VVNNGHQKDTCHEEDIEPCGQNMSIIYMNRGIEHNFHKDLYSDHLIRMILYCFKLCVICVFETKGNKANVERGALLFHFDFLQVSIIISNHESCMGNLCDYQLLNNKPTTNLKQRPKSHVEPEVLDGCLTRTNLFEQLSSWILV
jgi:hypothetical protein